MKKISAYQAAALLLISRLLSLSLYTASDGENTLITALTAVSVSIAKAFVMLPAVYLLTKYSTCTPEKIRKITSVLMTIGAGGYLLILADRFSSLIETVAPERFTRIGVIAVLLGCCAYTASMGLKAAARTASLILPSVILLFAAIFIELRPSMLTDRLNLYSDDTAAQVTHTLKRLLSDSYDMLLISGLLPNIQSRPDRAIKLYTAADSLITVIFFMMSTCVLGDMSGSSGSVWYTLSYCTHGSVIDRSEAVFMAASTVFAALTGAALLFILKESVKVLLPNISGNAAVLITSALLTAALAWLGVNRNGIGRLPVSLCIAVIAAIVTASCAAPLIGRRKEKA